MKRGSWQKSNIFSGEGLLFGGISLHFQLFVLRYGFETFYRTARRARGQKVTYQCNVMPAISFLATAQGLEVSMLDNFADTKRLLFRIWSQDVIIANSCEPERGIIRAYFYVKGTFKYYVIMFLTFLGPPTQLFDDLQYCSSSKIAIFWPHLPSSLMT